MAKDKLPTFVLHDESVNTHGFRMLTSGADLTEFIKNPVMLLNHDDWDLPIGKWVNIRVEGDRILAEADFDMADEQAKEIARKVADGYIRACSIGAWAIESSDDPKLMLPGQKLSTITKWQAREASICPIPANHNALALYDAYGAKINMESEIDLETVIQLIDNPNNKSNAMNRELLNLLSLSDNATEQEVTRAVENLQLEKKELNDQLNAIREEERKAQREEATELINNAIASGQIDASARDSMQKLFDADPESAKVILSALPKRQSIARQLNKDHRSDPLLEKSWDELDRSGGLAKLRDKYPDRYEELKKEKFNLK
ncbi:HK97 family phage prohead protease [Porphyromonadaceae bacterium W3.11]|nr:HK97 family phage prohead protease [Porphyromonadaceae bacterium W3.11]